MSVYTIVSRQELTDWIARYAIGELVDMQGITTGIENTNYFVDTTVGRYVLTLYERLPIEDLPSYLHLIAHLAREGIPCPAPVADRTGALFGVLNGKPAGFLTRLAGDSVLKPTQRHCAAVGDVLARLHLAGKKFTGHLENRRGPLWRQQTARAVRRFLDADQAALLDTELTAQKNLTEAGFPRGPIHADLFRDNVLFDGGNVSGVVDFGFAAIDALAYDLAITVNDWCTHPDATLVDGRVHALVRAYDAVRPLTVEEKIAWPLLLRAAALRFWLSRLYDVHLPRPGELTQAKDPLEFERILRARAAAGVVFPLS